MWNSNSFFTYVWHNFCMSSHHYPHVPLLVFIIQFPFYRTCHMKDWQRGRSILLLSSAIRRGSSNKLKQHGFSMDFYIQCWEVIKIDILCLPFRTSHSQEFFLKTLNATYIALNLWFLKEMMSRSSETIHLSFWLVVSTRLFPSF